jgi:hypothetical protein
MILKRFFQEMTEPLLFLIPKHKFFWANFFSRLTRSRKNDRAGEKRLIAHPPLIASFLAQENPSKNGRNQSDLEKYLTGFKSPNYTKAFKLLKPLAEAGNAEAQCIIANMYHLGLGVEMNLPEAIKWYLKSSQQGSGIASHNLGILYLSGGKGILPNKNEAERYFQKAREQGF